MNEVVINDDNIDKKDPEIEKMLGIILKYKDNNIDSITKEDIDFICTFFESKEKIKKLTSFPREYYVSTVNSIVYRYCVKYDDTEVALNFGKNEYEYDYSLAINEFLYSYVANQLDKNNTDILKYDYPYMNICFAWYMYEKKDIDAALEYLKKGASQFDRYCITELIRYYVDDGEAIDTSNGKIDFDESLYYAQLSLNLFQEIDSYEFDKIFDEIEKLPEDERKKYELIIDNSKELLYERALSLGNCENNRKLFYDKLYDISVSSILKYQKASFALNRNENYCCLYNEKIFDDDITIINELVVKEDVYALSKYSAKELFCYGLYYIKNKLMSNAYIVLKMASLKDDKYAYYAIGLYNLINDTEKELECLVKSADLGCLSAKRVILYNEKFISLCPEKKEIYFNDIYENSVNPDELYDYGDEYKSPHSLNEIPDVNFKVDEHDYNKALKFFEKAKKYGCKKCDENILYLKYLLDDKIDLKEYIDISSRDYENDYMDKIKNLFDDGYNFITINTLEKCRELKTNNSNSNVIDLLISYVDSLPNNTIINIKQSVYESPLMDLYSISDFKKVLSECKLLLSDVDLNQKAEDIFMQIYIKVANTIEYDTEAVLKGENDENVYTSRNLISLSRRKGVCLGYSYILKFLLNIVGIESNVVVSNFDSEGKGHAFNQVKMDDKWYYCDLTYDKKMMMKYGLPLFCLRSQEKFLQPTFLLKLKDDFFHISFDNKLVYSSSKDYRNTILLFQKNKIKLLKQKIFSRIKKDGMEEHKRVF